MSLNRICRLSHSVPLNQDRCSEGHPLAASLQCPINDCEPDSDDEATDKKTCPLCFKIFHNKLNMKRHRKIHHDGSMRLKCSDCEKTFASKTALQYHKNRIRAEDAKITCNGCNADYKIRVPVIINPINIPFLFS